MFDPMMTSPTPDSVSLSGPETEAARRGALPRAPLAMPRQRLERDPAPTLLARLRALLAQRLDA